jgi:hypothetical protein
MLTPYPIYFDKRPVKTAFLISSKMLNKETFSRIFDYNTSLWNGKFNPIIFTDGKTIQDTAWQFLLAYDPDEIKSFLNLSKTLLQRIYQFLSPHRVELLDINNYIQNNNCIRIEKPTPELISKLSQYDPFDKSVLILFKVSRSVHPALKYFIQFNFGIYEEFKINQIIRQNLKSVVFEINDSKGFNKSLCELSDVYRENIFPIQFCGLPNELEEVTFKQDNNNFSVIVGDSPYDFANYWNRSISIPQWLRTKICHVWLPTEIANDDDIKEGLQLFFHQRNERVGNSQSYKSINFLSYSLSEIDLKAIAQKLIAKPYINKKVSSEKPNLAFPELSQRYFPFQIKSNWELYQAYGTEENVLIDEPKLPEGIKRGKWMLDVYLQYKTDRDYFSNTKYWLQLPNRNQLANMLFPQKSARIKKDGVPSVVMVPDSLGSIEVPGLKIILPSENQIIQSLLTSHEVPRYIDDLRNNIVNSRNEYYTNVSEKGRYLQGIIGLFEDLRSAYSSFQEQYWRKMFNILSHVKPSSDSAKKQVIINKLNKNTDFNNKEWLADFIIKLAKEYSKHGREVKYDTFLHEKLLEINESLRDQNKNNKKIKDGIKYEKMFLLEDLKRFVDNGIILMGIRPHCPRCGYANWIHINEIEQENECKGCTSKFNIPPEEPWVYRLNSLIQDGINQHGLIPVLLTLGQLRQEARLSFLYSPSLDIFKAYKKNGKHLGDIDIVCIKDGKLIIGEIKQSSSLFKTKHFEQALMLSKIIRPSVFIFASLVGGIKPIIEENIKRLTDELKPMGITAQWYKIQEWK